MHARRGCLAQSCPGWWQFWQRAAMGQSSRHFGSSNSRNLTTTVYNWHRDPLLGMMKLGFSGVQLSRVYAVSLLDTAPLRTGVPIHSEEVHPFTSHIWWAESYGCSEGYSEVLWGVEPTLTELAILQWGQIGHPCCGQGTWKHMEAASES